MLLTNALYFSYSPKDLRPLVVLPNLHGILINKLPIGRPLIEKLRAEADSAMFWLKTAFAGRGSETDVEEVLELAAKPDNVVSRPFRGVSGLPLIHESEASLDEVITAPPTIGQDNQQYDEKNFMGEFVIDSKGGVQKKK